MTKKSNVVYTITGKEREELVAIQRQMASLEGAFLALVSFLGRRQGIDLAKVKFDPQALAFVKPDKLTEVNKP